MTPAELKAYFEALPDWVIMLSIWIGVAVGFRVAK